MRDHDFDWQCLERIYAIPTREAKWQDALEPIWKRVGIDSFVLMAERSDGVDRLHLEGHDEATWESYEHQFVVHDPFVAAIHQGRVKADQIFDSSSLIDQRVLQKGIFYNEFWLPNDIGQVAGGFTRGQDGQLFHLALTRDRRGSCYNQHDLAVLERFSPHIFRAAQLQRALQRPWVEPDLDHFAKRYGLTCAETRLLVVFPETRNLRTAAERLNRSHNTTRAQMRSIYAKTKTRSQVELMTLLHQH